MTRNILLLLILSVAISLGMSSLSVAATTDVRLYAYELTGELELVNKSDEIVSLGGYSIESEFGSLIFGNWTPVTNRLDSAGDGSFDPANDWIILSPTPSSTDLTEGAAMGAGGLLAPGANLSLGDVWNTSLTFDITASVIVDDLAGPADVLFIPIGDYNSDGAVNFGDFFIYRNTYGSTTDLRADGNLDGIVDSIDYAIWREARPANAELAPQNLAVVIPEPGTLALIPTWMLLGMRRASRRCQRAVTRPTTHSAVSIGSA